MADKPWLAHYDADVPPSLHPYPHKTLLDYLAALAREHAAKPALLFKGAENCRRRAQKTLSKVYRKVGFVPAR